MDKEKFGYFKIDLERKVKEDWQFDNLIRRWTTHLIFLFFAGCIFLVFSFRIIKPENPLTYLFGSFFPLLLFASIPLKVYKKREPSKTQMQKALLEFLKKREREYSEQHRELLESAGEQLSRRKESLAEAEEIRAKQAFLTKYREEFIE